VFVIKESIPYDLSAALNHIHKTFQYQFLPLAFTTTLFRPTDRSSSIKILYLSDTFSASALISIRCPDGYFPPGNWEKLQQIDPREISSAFHRAGAEIAEKGNFWMETI